MSSFFLKIFALIFMIIDHIGFILFPNEVIFRAIGRLAFPLFAYQMAVGYSHTSNKARHIFKLVLFATLCQIPVNMIHNLYNIKFTLNIIFTFVFSLLIIFTIENFKFCSENKNKEFHFNIKNFFITLLMTLFLVILGIHLNVDYSWYGILLTVFFYFTLQNKSLSIISLFILLILNFLINQTFMSLLAFISLFDCVFILLFNGNQGHKISWFFYAIYFLHFFPLLLIKSYIN